MKNILWIKNVILRIKEIIEKLFDFSNILKSIKKWYKMKISFRFNFKQFRPKIMYL